MTLKEKLTEAMNKHNNFPGSKEEFDKDELGVIRKMSEAAEEGFDSISLESVARHLYNGRMKDYGLWVNRHHQRLEDEGITIKETTPTIMRGGVYTIVLSWGK